MKCRILHVPSGEFIYFDSIDLPYIYIELYRFRTAYRDLILHTFSTKKEAKLFLQDATNLECLYDDVRYLHKTNVFKDFNTLSKKELSYFRQEFLITRAN